jgi:6-pyruvoyltetrahydropterin/6-carboxytetrahydropterin synthase
MKITQAFTFEAAHSLPNVSESHRCRRVHGHSYRIELTIEGPVDAKSGFVIDFFDLEAAFGPILAQLDHFYLNEVEGLANPTAENISVWIWRNTKPLLPQLCLVRLFETPNCWAEFAGEDN